MLNYIFLSSSSVQGPTGSKGGMGCWHRASCKGKKINISQSNGVG